LVVAAVEGVAGLLGEAEDATEVAGVVAEEPEDELELEELEEAESLGLERESDSCWSFFHDDGDRFTVERLSFNFPLLGLGKSAFSLSWELSRSCLPLPLTSSSTELPSNQAPTFPHQSTNACSKAVSSPRNAVVTPQTFGFSSIRVSSLSLISTRFSAYCTIRGGGGDAVS
jgi:hypothetical protein